ncbi:MAG: hypothetical protein HY270_02840 [Deltaproteobacteria bacterium]|nr:hypothetical protein [Deltaproteobacteria bacterium]
MQRTSAGNLIAHVRRSIVSAAALSILAAPTQAATFVVNNPFDVSDAMAGDGVCATAGGACTLRAAIEEANELAGADTISVPAGNFGLSHGQLEISSDLTINGAGAKRTVVDGNFRSRVFQVSSTGAIVVTISNLTVQHGAIDGFYEDSGGGIFNDSAAPLTLTGVRILRNRIPGAFSSYGGGLYNSASAILTDVVVKANQALSDSDSGLGGGIYNEEGGTMSITNSVISRNSIACVGASDSYGGGIENLGNMTLTNVTLTANRATGLSSSCNVYGGGIDSGSLTAVLNGSNLAINGNAAIGRQSSAYGGGMSITYNTATLSGVSAHQNRAVARQSDDSADGGGVMVAYGATLNLSDAEIVRNRVVGGGDASGGGIEVEGTLVLTTSLVSRNQSAGMTAGAAPCGGGVANFAMATISDTVISLNRATGVDPFDGGICGTASLTNVTLAGNVP